MKYPAYPKYKASGVEWLGEVPEHWEVIPLKHVTSFQNGMAFKPEGWADEGVPIIRIENLNGGDSFNGYDGFVLQRYHVQFEDLLFGWSGNRGTSFGPYIWPRQGLHYLNQHIFKLYDYSCDKSWFYWCLYGVTKTIEDEAHGIIGMVHVTQTKLGSINIPAVPYEEQRAIAAFLDAKTAKLDTLIAKKRELIAKLKEKRAALITHTVTRGLPPDAATAAGLDPHPKMKDSGVEWLGEVPEHWEVKRLKHIAKLQTGITLGKDRHNKHTVSVPYLRVANVQDGYIDTSDVSEIEIEAHELQNYALRKGDVLMNEGGDNDKLGRGAVWSGDISPCIHQNHVFCFRPFGVSSEFLSLFTQSLCAKHYLFLSSRQSTNLASISSRNIIEIHIPVPPRPEQELILGYLADRFAQIDTTSRLAEETIEKLLEYRAALITAAVTGQIDVREAVQ